MLDEQILALQYKLEEMETTKCNMEGELKTVKADITTMKRAIKAMSRMSEQLND